MCHYVSNGSMGLLVIKNAKQWSVHWTLLHSHTQNNHLPLLKTIIRQHRT